MLAVSCGYYYLTHTSQGARWLFDNFAGRYLGAKTVKYRGFDGTIAQGIHLSNVRIEDLNKFTTRSLVLIQQLDLAVPDLDITKISIKIRNGRIKFPLSDPIGFYGSFADGFLKFNVYCGIIDVREIVTVVKSDLSLHNLKGTAKKASMVITGPYTQPILNGEFLLEDFRYLGFSLAQLPATFRYTLDRDDRGLQWKGDLSVPSGVVTSRLTKIDLKPSRLIFTGPFKNPGLDINGSSKVNQTLINVSLGGTKQKPELNVTSNPPKSRNVILVMLATGQELVLPDNADTNHPFAGSDRDFVEYFTFASEGQSSEAVGLTNFSVNMQDDAKWLGIKKKVTDQLKVGINLQETRAVSAGGNTDVTRTIGGEVQVADHITLGVDKKVTQIVDPAKNQSTSEQKDSGVDVTIKYKKSF
jgi:hypothetical protein